MGPTLGRLTPAAQDSFCRRIRWRVALSMVCQYCNKRLGIIQRLKGQSFCSVEHQELHFSLSFERLHESVSGITPNQLEPKQARFKPDWMLAKQEQPPATAVPLETKAEQTPAEQVVETQVSQEVGPAVVEASPTLEIASLVEAVGTSSGVDVPEALFLHEMPARQDQPAAPLKCYAEALISSTVQLPLSPILKTALQASPPRVLDVLPAPPPVEATPVANQATFRAVPQVPQGYPPVVISASATLLLDSKDAKLLPLPMGEPYRGRGPLPPPRTEAIEMPLPQPRLLTRQADRQPAPVPDRPPQAPACDPLWKGRLGRGPAVPALTGVLRPQRDVVRLVPPAGRGNSELLSSFPLFAEEPEIPVAPGKLVPIAPAGYFPATISLRPALYAPNSPLTPGALALVRASRPLALGSITPSRSEPSFSQVDSAWLPTAVARQLPGAAIVPRSGRSGLSLVANAAPIGCSSATNLPPAVETAPSVASAIPFLIFSRRSSTATPAPAMPLWSGTWPLLRSPSRLPTQASELEISLRTAFLQPSSPSPMSLVTWSHSLSISIPARNPSNLGGAAPIGMSANRGRPQALRPWSPGRRVHRITPLLPQPNEMGWAPVAPTQASLRPPAIQPIRPGSEGTAPPPLGGVRVQPASMPVLPLVTDVDAPDHPRSAPFCASSLEAPLKLACIDMAHHTSRMAWEADLESNPVLPSFFSAQPHAPAIVPAPSSPRVWGGAMPPVQTAGTVRPFPALQRLAWSLTAGLPTSGQTGRLGLTPFPASDASVCP